MEKKKKKHWAFCTSSHVFLCEIDCLHCFSHFIYLFCLKSLWEEARSGAALDADTKGPEVSTQVVILGIVLKQTIRFLATLVPRVDPTTQLPDARR